MSLIINNLRFTITRLRLFHSIGAQSGKDGVSLENSQKIKKIVLNESNLEQDSVFSTLCPHKVEKSESRNNQAQVVYNQIYQFLTEKGMSY